MHSIWDTTDRLATGEQFLWFRRFGYVRARNLIRGGVLLYVFLTGIVTVAASDLITLVFVGILAVIVLQLASVDRYFSPRRSATVYTEGGFFIAEHVDTGTVRHGDTLEDALRNLTRALPSDPDDHERLTPEPGE